MIEATLSGEVLDPLRFCVPPTSAFAGFRFPPELSVVAVRWYLRFALFCRDVEELLVERGVDVDHVTVHRWIRWFAPLLADAARFARHSPGDRWFVGDTYVKVNGVWRYVYRPIDQYGQIIDVLVSARRNCDAARRFFQRALSTLKVAPSELVIDMAAIYAGVLDELVPSTWHHVERYTNNPIEADHIRLKRRLRSMHGLRIGTEADHAPSSTVIQMRHALKLPPRSVELDVRPRPTLARWRWRTSVGLCMLLPAHVHLVRRFGSIDGVEDEGGDLRCGTDDSAHRPVIGNGSCLNRSQIGPRVRACTSRNDRSLA